MSIRKFLLFTVVCGCFLPFNVVLATLQDGTNGVHGYRGSPGDGGGRGGDASDQVLERFGFGKPFYWFGTGFQGGRGGNGGDGFIRNANPSDTAAGGQGGHGGRGSDVAAVWSARVTDDFFQREVHVEATGGNGGASGSGGLGFQGGPNGLAGFGGSGGSAHASAEAGFNATARAVGGRGGDAAGWGGQGGQGGSASAAVILTNPELHDEARFFAATGTMMVVGGAGGQGFNGAHGGHGGRALLGGDVNNFSINSGEYQFYGLRAIGRGGEGGSSTGGNGGIGGHVFADLSSMQDGSRFLNAAHQGDYTLNGGNGGHSLAHHLFGGHGGEGGSVLVGNSHFFSTAHTLRISARGGHGGDSLGSFGGNGGRGGAIVFEPLRLGNYLALDLRLRGGNGGHSFSGNGGHGRTVAVHNPLLSGDDSFGGNQIDVSVRGGNGGHLLGTQSPPTSPLRRAGDGGHARVTMINAFPKLDIGALNVQAIGGWAGQGLGQAGVERAGNAYAEVRQSMGRWGSIHALAEGGRSLHRVNGNAFAIADLTLGQETASIAGGLATATARPYQYFHNNQPYPLAAVGGNAYSEAKITRYSGSASTAAIANSEGGFGTLQSGWSHAVAIAVNQTDFFSPTPAPDATAIATARSRADGSSSSANNALSHATAVGYFKADAQATARAEGQYNYGHAVAQFQALRGLGRAAATAQGETIQWAHRSDVSATAVSNGNYSAELAGMNASAYSSFRQTYMPELEQHSAWNHVLINPRRSAVDEFTLSSSWIDANFEFGGSNNHVGNILALGQIGGGNSDYDQSPSNFQALNRFELTIDLFPVIQETDRLALAFFNPIATGNGFDSLAVTFDYQGERILDVDFSDLSSANAFFHDRIIALDSLVTTSGLERQFALNFDLRFSKSTDSFGFDFLIGSQNQVAKFANFTSVPEPSGLPILLFALATQIWSRRRR